jgi:hypothetical protein
MRTRHCIFPSIPSENFNSEIGGVCAGLFKLVLEQYFQFGQRVLYFLSCLVERQRAQDVLIGKTLERWQAIGDAETCSAKKQLGPREAASHFRSLADFQRKRRIRSAERIGAKRCALNSL